MQLREYITHSKKKVADFAKEIGVTRDCVQKYLSGKRKPANEDLLQKIAAATGGLVTANDFYGVRSITAKPKRRS